MVVVDRLIHVIGVDLAGTIAVDCCRDVAEQLGQLRLVVGAHPFARGAPFGLGAHDCDATVLHQVRRGRPGHAAASSSHFSRCRARRSHPAGADDTARYGPYDPASRAYSAAGCEAVAVQFRRSSAWLKKVTRRCSNRVRLRSGRPCAAGAAGNQPTAGGVAGATIAFQWAISPTRCPVPPPARSSATGDGCSSRLGGAVVISRRRGPRPLPRVGIRERTGRPPGRPCSQAAGPCR